MRYKYAGDTVSNRNYSILLKHGYVNENIYKNLCIHENNFDEVLYTPEEDTVFSDSEAGVVKTRAVADSNKKKSAIPLAILLFFALGLRVGEMCALQWRDIITRADGRKMLHVQREVVMKKGGGYKLLPHCKTRAGDRFLPLNGYCLEIFRKIRHINADKGIPTLDPKAFIFQRQYHGVWTYCTVRSFDPRIRKYCREAHMDVEKSLHDIRRTCLTVMYDNGTPIKQLQYFAGHETVTQTLEYIRRRADTDIEQFILDDSGLFQEYREGTEKVTNF